jgi:hypothetical protein
MDEVEVALANYLIIMVGGNRPSLSPDQVRLHLSHHFGIREGDV